MRPPSIHPSLAPLKQVKAIQFGLLTSQEIERSSVAEIKNGERFADHKGRPINNGVKDLKLGATEDMKCATCEMGYMECPGHFGHVKLALPVYHPAYITKIKKILSCVCYNCGKLKTDTRNGKFVDALMQKNPGYRFEKVHHLCRNIRICENKDDEDLYMATNEGEEDIIPELNRKIVLTHGGCGAKQPKIVVQGVKIKLVYKENEEESENPQYTTQEIINILKKISDDDCRDMGLNPEFTRPEDFMFTCFPIPPLAIRPSVNAGTGNQEDDLTIKLMQILISNQKLASSIAGGSPLNIILDAWSVLQWNIWTYMNNKSTSQIPIAKYQQGRTIKSIGERLGGKSGRVRLNLMGKRVNFTARTVITADPNLSLDEIGVPEKIAMRMTVPEHVTVHNLDFIRELIKESKVNYVTYPTGRTANITVIDPANVSIYPGCIVERFMRNGDVIIFNRQPSLHKPSMMGHRVRVLPFSTFRMNLSATTPYNADFDGDEMNLHLPQSLEAVAEIKELAMVHRQIMSQQVNAPLMGIVQDALLATRKMTKRDTFIEKQRMMNMCLILSEWDGHLPEPAILKPVPLWTGKQMYSMILKERVNLISINNSIDDAPPTDFSKADHEILIVNGHLLAGMITKPNVGAKSKNSIITNLVREYGTLVARQFYDDSQKVVNHWLLHNGFSVGIGDAIPNKEASRIVLEAVAELNQSAEQIMEDARTLKFERDPGSTYQQTLENKIHLAANAPFEKAKSAAQRELKTENNFNQMMIAGSKGGAMNISQMMVQVGPQIVYGNIIPLSFGDRSHPFYNKGDNTPQARGFIPSSYLKGLTSVEFFFHAMGGRTGLIDTAIKTAETGYLQRRLGKFQEDVHIAYDRTVRNFDKSVIQFLYGDDGLDPAEREIQEIPSFRVSDAEFHKKYRIDLLDPDYTLGSGLIEWEIAEILSSDPAYQDEFDKEFEQLENDRNMLRTAIFKSSEQKILLPVLLTRLIMVAQKKFEIDYRVPSNLNPATVPKLVSDMLESLQVTFGSDDLGQEIRRNAILLFSILVRATLSSKRVVREYHLTKEAFEWILSEIEARYMKSIIDPGEMVGSLSAQFVCEPTTQLTLNTFHSAGTAQQVTAGLPKIQEILNVTAKVKLPATIVYLVDEFNASPERARLVGEKLQFADFRALVKHYTKIRDIDPTTSILEQDKEMVELFYETEEIDSKVLEQTVLRVVLDRHAMAKFGVNISTVSEILTETLGSEFQVIASDVNAEEQVIRFRWNKNGAETLRFGYATISETILNIPISGMRGVKAVHYIDPSPTLERINERGLYEKKKETCILVEGNNFDELLAVEEIDSTRTYSSSIPEIFRVLGVEAARQSIVDEFIRAIGNEVDSRHIALLADVMTYRGRVESVTRHGLQRQGLGPITQSTFEQTLEAFTSAAGNGQIDELKGVSENVILGQLVPAGTGSFQVLLDVGAVAQALPPPKQISPRVGRGYDRTDGYNMAAGRYMNQDQSEYMAASPYSPVASQWSPQGIYSPSSPTQYSPNTAYGGYGAVSPTYQATSPYMPAVSPKYGQTSPSYLPTSPTYSPTSPTYSPTSPTYSPTSPTYSPTSPTYSPTSPTYSPTGAYSPSSPTFAPTSPTYAPNTVNPTYSPTSPAYSLTSPTFSPNNNPTYSPNQAYASSEAFDPTYFSPYASNTFNQEGTTFNPDLATFALPYSDQVAPQNSFDQSGTPASKSSKNFTSEEKNDKDEQSDPDYIPSEDSE